MRPRTTLRFGRHRLAPAIQRGTSHTQSLAGFRRLPNPPRQLLGRHDQSFSSLSSGFRGIPSSSEVFFGISSIVSTRARRRWSRAFSRSSSLTRGSSAFAFRPRFLDVIPTLAISSRWRRQLDNCDEYKPSRRRRAATSPSTLAEGIGLTHYPQLVLRAKASTLRLLAHFGILDPPHRGRRDLSVLAGSPIPPSLSGRPPATLISRKSVSG